MISSPILGIKPNGSVFSVKSAERILLKITIIQFIFLLLAQLVLHRYDILPEISKITKYEGVEGSTYTQFLETFQGR